MKQHHSKVLLNSFPINGHTLAFCPYNQKLENFVSPKASPAMEGKALASFLNNNELGNHREIQCFEMTAFQFKAYVRSNSINVSPRCVQLTDGVKMWWIKFRSVIHIKPSNWLKSGA